MSSKSCNSDQKPNQPKDEKPKPNTIHVGGTDSVCKVVISIPKETKKTKDTKSNVELCEGGLCTKCDGTFYACGYGKDYF